MEVPSKILEQIAFNTRHKLEEQMLKFMDKSTHEEHLSQPLQTNNKHITIAVTFLTGYNVIFEITNKNNKFYFKKSITDGDDFIQINRPSGAHENEILNNEIKTIIIDEGHFTTADYPFKIKPNFTTLGSFIEISPQGPIISFIFDDTIRNLLGFRETIFYQEYNLSQNRVEFLSLDNIFLECDIAQGMTFKGNRSGIFHNFTMDVDPGYKYIEIFRGGVQWYMVYSKDIISSISFKLKNENNQFNGQNVSFRLSITDF